MHKFFRLEHMVAVTSFSDCLYTVMTKACLLRKKKCLYSFPAVLRNNRVIAQLVNLFGKYYVFA